MTLALLEPLAFFGVTIGFVDADAPDFAQSLPQKLATPGSVLLVPGTTHVPLGALHAIAAAHETRRGSVHAFGLRAYGSSRGLAPEEVLTYRPTGERWDSATRGTLSTLPGSEAGGGPASMLRALEDLIEPDREHGKMADAGKIGAGTEDDGPHWLGGPTRRVRVIDEVVHPGLPARGRPNTAVGVFSRAVPGDAAETAGDAGGEPTLGRADEVVLFIANLRSSDCAVTLMLVPPTGGYGLPAAAVFDVWEDEPIVAANELHAGATEPSAPPSPHASAYYTLPCARSIAPSRFPPSSDIRVSSSHRSHRAQGGRSEAPRPVLFEVAAAAAAAPAAAAAAASASVGATDPRAAAASAAQPTAAIHVANSGAAASTAALAVTAAPGLAAATAAVVATSRLLCHRRG